MSTRGVGGCRQNLVHLSSESGRLHVLPTTHLVQRCWPLLTVDGQQGGQRGRVSGGARAWGRGKEGQGHQWCGGVTSGVDGAQVVWRGVQGERK